MDRPTPKRLSYLGSKCVIQHLEVYKRHSLATLCPSLRSIHQLTPLTIDNLRLGSSYYVLNGFVHKFGGFNVETSQLELKITKVDNDEGLNKQDQYWGDDVDLEPSDLKIGNFFREGRQPQGIDLANQFHLPPRVSASQHSRFLPGVNARDAARSHLAKVLSRDTRVKNLTLVFVAGVLTMPAGYKFKVQNLSLFSDQFLDPVASIMEASHFKTLKIRSITEPEQSARHPLLRAFERLEIGPILNLNWNSYLENLPNTQIHLHGVFPPTPAQYGNLARRWVRENRRVGTRLLVDASQIWGPIDVQKVLETIRQELRGKWKQVPEVPRWVVYPFDDSREIKIYGLPDPNLEMIVMEVVELDNVLAE